jgi:hypothetical protein
MTSLFDFLAAATDRCLGRGLSDSLLDCSFFDTNRVEMNRQAARQVAEKVLSLAWQGDYPLARRLACVFQDNGHLADEPPDDESHDYVGCPELLRGLGLNTLVPRDLFGLAACQKWSAFAWACELAERIDGRLAVLERGGPATTLARGCREDLDGLAVLADWCEDAGLPLTAAEARLLLGLAVGEMRRR